MVYWVRNGCSFTRCWPNQRAQATDCWLYRQMVGMRPLQSSCRCKAAASPPLPPTHRRIVTDREGLGDLLLCPPLFLTAHYHQAAWLFTVFGRRFCGILSRFRTGPQPKRTLNGLEDELNGIWVRFLWFWHYFLSTIAALRNEGLVTNSRLVINWLWCVSSRGGCCTGQCGWWQCMRRAGCNKSSRGRNVSWGKLCRQRNDERE